MRNPTWSREELILALDLYFRVHPSHIDDAHPDVIELSRVLRSLAIHPRHSQGASFRSPASVYMKLCNFLRCDPTYRGSGLRAGGMGEVDVWREFAEDRERLARVAASIRRNAGRL